MVQPRGDYQNPFGFTGGLYEGFETYLGGGSSAHGYGAAGPLQWAVKLPQHVPGPTAVGYGAPVHAVEPVDWVASAQPRSPFSGWAVPNTPQPSTDLVPVYPPGIGAPSDPLSRGEAKAAKLKEPPTSDPRGIFAFFHRGRRVSWP